VFFVPFDGGQFRGRALGIQRIDFFRFGVIDQQGGVSANSVHRRIDNTQYGLAGNDRVKSVAAFFQNALGSAGGFRLHRRDREVLTAHDRAHGFVCTAAAFFLSHSGPRKSTNDDEEGRQFQ
jgi:hypothetical protein